MSFFSKSSVSTRPPPSKTCIVSCSTFSPQNTGIFGAMMHNTVQRPYVWGSERQEHDLGQVTYYHLSLIPQLQSRRRQRRNKTPYKEKNNLQGLLQNSRKKMR